VVQELAGLGSCLDDLGSRGRGLDHCRARCAELAARIESLAFEDSASEVRWYEIYAQGFRFHRTPVTVAETFGAQVAARPGAWVFTSATLAVGDSFRHFCAQLGLDQADTGIWGSPFDYQRQALLLVPQGLPEPQAPGFIEAVARLALRILGWSRGRAFLLFTSHRALQEAARWLQDRVPYPLLVQGSAPRGELLERFRRAGNAVLLGTSSFWEGVDVRGEALSCVIIDKLPFASPGDPVLQARLDALRKQGDNPFLRLQLPQAVISLKQGAGRLIRDVGDRGVLVICDPRLSTRSYGRAFLDSLPPMRRTRGIEEVAAFFLHDRAPTELGEDAGMAADRPPMQVDAAPGH
jgi:ATP-dependent DNA helicase DinG